MNNIEGLKRAMDLTDTANSGIGFCTGCFSAMGPNVVEANRKLKEAGFTGSLLDDHLPHAINDPKRGHRS